LLSLLVFFTTPSKAQQVSSLTLSLVLLVDTIIILAVGRIRHEEGWVGIVSVVWSVFVSIWAIVTDRTVAWGKHEEEERLTGRIENRRTVGEWFSVLFSNLLGLIFIVISILFTITLSISARDASLEAPGTRYWVDNGRYQVHLACVGSVSSSKTPTILIEGGEAPVEGGFAPFIANAYANGTIPRYCYWDRPGLGFSDTGPSPLSAGTVVDSLSEALVQANETGPWILASAGIGSIYSRIFSARHPTLVKGILLLDPTHEDYLSSIGSTKNGFLLWAYGVISPLGIERIPAAIFRGRTRQDRVFGRSAYQGGKYIKAKLQESLVAGSLTLKEVESARAIQSADVALSILSSGKQIKKHNDWSDKQKDLSTLTDNLVGWEIVPGAPHEIWATYEGRQAAEKQLKKLVARING
jgi:pimeloyl-ACP methyl ester carboxylesterase